MILTLFYVYCSKEVVRDGDLIGGERHQHGGEVVVLLHKAGEMPEDVIALGDGGVDPHHDEVGVRGFTPRGIVDGIGVVVRLELFRVRPQGEDKHLFRARRGQEKHRQTLDDDNDQNKDQKTAHKFLHRDSYVQIRILYIV